MASRNNADISSLLYGPYGENCKDSYTRDNSASATAASKGAEQQHQRRSFRLSEATDQRSSSLRLGCNSPLDPAEYCSSSQAALQCMLKERSRLPRDALSTRSDVRAAGVRSGEYSGKSRGTMFSYAGGVAAAISCSNTVNGTKNHSACSAAASVKSTESSHSQMIGGAGRVDEQDSYKRRRADHMDTLSLSVGRLSVGNSATVNNTATDSVQSVNGDENETGSCNGADSAHQSRADISATNHATVDQGASTDCVVAAENNAEHKQQQNNDV